VRRQTYGYLPSRRASPPLDWYQILLLGDRGPQKLTLNCLICCSGTQIWLPVQSVTFTSCGEMSNHMEHAHTLCPGLPGWAGTRKVKPIWILLEQQTVSGSGISWVICKSAPRSRQITMPAPHHSVYLQAGCPSCRPTNSVKALKVISNHMELWNNNVSVKWCCIFSTVYTTVTVIPRVWRMSRLCFPIY